MIATTRLGKAQDAMRNAKGYGAANSEVFSSAEAGKEEASADRAAEKVLWIVSSSDRGLCGGIHSSVSKRFRKEVGAAAGESQVVVLGDKSKAQLSRATPEAIVLTFNQIGKQVPTFQDACAIASLIEDSRAEFDKVNLIYNKVVSAVRLASSLRVSVLDGLRADRVRGGRARGLQRQLAHQGAQLCSLRGRGRRHGPGLGRLCTGQRHLRRAG
jgi:F-type H+-transporting ATPase subunit gamma